MMGKTKLILFTAVVMLCANVLKAQVCGATNLQLNELVYETELIVIGKVIKKHSFWNDTKTNIYTEHIIEIEQATKFNANKVAVLTEGGTVDDLTFEIFGLPNLTLQSEGVFFLNKNYNTITNNTNNNYYNLVDVGNYNATTNKIENSNSIITIDNFNKLLTQKHKAVFSFTNSKEKSYKLEQATISNINPKIIGGGSNKVLTITGSGFGTLTGSAKIAMRSAGSLSASAFIDIDKTNIKNWTDTKIQFEVPGDEITSNFAGVASGKIKVTNSAGLVTTSSKTVEISFNRKVFKGTSVRLRGKNQNGAIPFYVERRLINDGALPAVKSALEIWNCAAGSNFVYGGIVDNVCKEYDEINVICYDSTIPTFNLAITKVVSRSCSAYNVADQIDADITFNSNLSWGFNDNITSGQFHFQSVLLHELGHAFMLSHVVNKADIMYPSLRNGLLKVEPTNNDVDGGLQVMSESASAVNCSSYGQIKPYNSESCNGCSNVTNIKAKNITENSVYLNWETIRNSVSYKMRYRFNGSKWYQYDGEISSLILFDLPACTTIECKLLSFCNNNERSESEKTYRFTTLGCQ